MRSLKTVHPLVRVRARSQSRERRPINRAGPEWTKSSHRLARHLPDARAPVGGGGVATPHIIPASPLVPAPVRVPAGAGTRSRCEPLGVPHRPAGTACHDGQTSARESARPCLSSSRVPGARTIGGVRSPRKHWRRGVTASRWRPHCDYPDRPTKVCPDSWHLRALRCRGNASIRISRR
jgi:hypothetical protein